MKILLLSSVEHQSGSAIRFRGLAQALQRRGHEVHLLEPVRRQAVLPVLEGIRRHPCPRLELSPVLQAPLWLAFGLMAVLRSRPHIVWALKALPNVWIPARCAWLLGARVAVDFDDLDASYYPAGPVRALLQGMFASAARRAEDATCHNSKMRELLDRMRGPGREAYFVDQGIDCKRWEVVPGRAAASTDSAVEASSPGRAAASTDSSRGTSSDSLRETLGVGAGPLLLYAGHLGPASDLGLLLPALEEVFERQPSARLLVVGGGTRLEEFQKIARTLAHPESVIFVGSVPHEETPRYFALADLAVNYLAPNDANPFRASIKVREALAAGIPVVTTRIPDTERFADFVRLVDPGPATMFAKAILDELAAPDRERAGRGREFLRQHGSFDAAVREVCEHWEARA